MSPYERRPGSNVLAGMDLTSSSKGNADTGQRDSGHLAVLSMQCGARTLSRNITEPLRWN
jgi:hypothetical protein